MLLLGEPHTVVGVMAPAFRFINPADVWTPLRPSQHGEGGGDNYSLIARVKDGVPWAKANAQVGALGQRILENRRVPPGVSARLGLLPLQERLSHNLRKPLLILWAAVGIVLLIGCVNIAALLLARAAGRSREMATRATLGAGRAAVVRQLLAESLLLAVLGGAVGAAVGWVGVRALSVLLPRTADVWQQFQVWQQLHIDARVLGVTIALSVLTSLVFGILPALSSSRIDVRAALAEGGSRGVAGTSSRWPRRILVTGEVALSVVLLVGAGLLVRSFLNLRHLAPGFDGRNVFAAGLSLQDARYRTQERVSLLFNGTIQQLREVPGIEAAGVGLHLPYERWLNTGVRRADGPNVTGEFTNTTLNYIAGDYLKVLRIPILAGRSIDDRDTASSVPVVIVNVAFARKYFGKQPAIGGHIAFRGDKQPRLVVGVTGDVQQRPGWGDGEPLAVVPAVYMPACQTSGEMLSMVHTWFSPSWVVRASLPHDQAVRQLQAVIEKSDPLLPVASFKTMPAVRDRTLAPQRLQAALLGTFAALALLLAAVGIAGTIAQSVGERRREMGVRLALGATITRSIAETALPGFLLAVVGVAAGTAIAIVATRVLRGAVYGLTTTDTATYVGVAVGLLVVGAAASCLPALRLLSLDPMQALREE